jgi:hypothetical protein
MLWWYRLRPTQGLSVSVFVMVCAVQARRAGRQQRFASDLASIKAVSRGGAGSSSSAFSEESIGSGWLALQGGFGSNMSLEKEYLRLTSVPKSEDVRPPEVGARVRVLQQLLHSAPQLVGPAGGSSCCLAFSGLQEL